MRITALLLTALLATSATAGAQTTRAPNPPIEASGNLESLEGRTWFGLHRSGKSVGTLELVVAKAGEGWSVKLRCRYQNAEKQTVELDEELALGSQLKLVRATLRQREGKEEARAEVRPDGGVTIGKGDLWKPPPETGRLRLFGVAHRMLVVNALLPVARKAVRYSVDVLDLPNRAVRPQALQVRRHSVWRNDLEAVFGKAGDSWRVRVLGKPTRIEELRHPDFPDLVFHYAADEAAAKRDRPPLELPYAAESPRGVVLDCLRGLLQGDPDAVSGTIDWSTLTRSLAKDETVAAFKKRFLARVAGVPSTIGTQPDDLTRVAPRLKQVELADGRVRVTVPGDRTKFILAQRDARWRIVDLR